MQFSFTQSNKQTARLLQFLLVYKGSNFKMHIAVFPCVNKMRA